jgi:hypothetical protein
MEQGFVLDQTRNARAVSAWVPGAPSKSFWSGTKLPDKTELQPIGAFRCSSCGYLELYARGEFAAS